MLSNLIIFLLLFLVSCKQDYTHQFSLEQIVFIGLITSILILFVISLSFARHRVNRIKYIYHTNKKQLHFWDKLDRIKLESALQNGKLPENWVVSLNQDKTKIEDIYFYDRLSAGRIAQDKDKLFASLRNRLSKR